MREEDVSTLNKSEYSCHVRFFIYIFLSGKTFEQWHSWGHKCAKRPGAYSGNDQDVFLESRLVEFYEGK